MKNLNQIAAQAVAPAIRRGQFANGNPVVKMVNKCKEESDEALDAIQEGNTTSPILDTESPTFYQDFEAQVKSGLGDELADIILCALIAANQAGIDIDAHVKMKMRYNELRP